MGDREFLDIVAAGISESLEKDLPERSRMKWAELSGPARAAMRKRAIAALESRQVAISTTRSAGDAAAGWEVVMLHKTVHGGFNVFWATDLFDCLNRISAKSSDHVLYSVLPVAQLRREDFK